MRRFWVFFILAVCFSVLPGQAAEKDPVFPSAKVPLKKFSVGEKFVYRIQYLGIPVGESEGEVKEILEVQGRHAYHLLVRVRSYSMIDWVYKVRDEHHSFLDVETLQPLRYEKNIREGRRRLTERLIFDPGRHTVRADHGNEATSPEEFSVPENVQDELSCGYWFRTLEVEPDTSVFIPVYADGKNWNLEIRLGKVREMDLEGIGKFSALEIEPLMGFQGIFFRKGKIRGWISLDERRIPLQMTVKIPVLGNVRAVLIQYVKGA